MQNSFEILIFPTQSSPEGRAAAGLLGDCIFPTSELVGQKTSAVPFRMFWSTSKRFKAISQNERRVCWAGRV